MKRILSTATLLLGLIFVANSSEAGLYLAGDYSMAKSKSEYSFFDGMSASSPGVTLGLSFMDRGQYPLLGIEAGWKKYTFSRTLSVFGSSSSFKIHDQAVNVGLRLWFWFLSAKAGYVIHKFGGPSATGDMSDSSAGAYIGGGVNIPIGGILAFYGDATYVTVATNFGVMEYTFGARLLL